MEHHVEKCCICGSNSVSLSTYSQTYEYLGKKYALDGLDEMKCTNCGVAYFVEGQIENNNERMKKFARTFIRGIAPWEVMELREMYLLTYEDAASIFGCTVEQFKSWERGDTAPTPTESVLLLTALQHTVFMNILWDWRRRLNKTQITVSSI